MAKKYYGKKSDGFGKIKNNYANMPQEVVHKSYPKRNYAIMEGSYVDTQMELDLEFNKAISRVRKGSRR